MPYCTLSRRAIQRRLLTFAAASLLGLCPVVPGHAEETAVDLRPMLPAVQSQGKRNTCNVFASTVLMEYLIQQKPHKPVRLSAAYAYWLGKTRAIDSDFLRGMYADIDGLAGWLAVKAFTFGCIEEAAWPYQAQNWEQLKDRRGLAADGKALPARFTGRPPKGLSLLPYKIKPIFIERAKIADFILAEKRPVVFNILWCQGAINSAGEFRMPTEKEVKEGQGHVILLVGYDKATKRFLFRNSWGEKWGKKGYGTIPEAYVVNYYEVKKFEPLAQHDKPTQDFLRTCMKGVSGELIIDGRPPETKGRG
jgi:hypothetical protein